MVWEPKQCCCGASVRVGTLIVGWLSLIGSIVQSFSVLKVVAFGLTRQDFVQICHNISQARHEQFDEQVCADAAIGFLILSGLICTLAFVVSIMLLVGVQKNKPMFMLPFLFSHGIGISLMSVLTIIGFLFVAVFASALAAFIILVMVGLILSLEMYLFLVVRACYKEVKQHHAGMIGDSNVAYVEQQDDLYKYKI